MGCSLVLIMVLSIMDILFILFILFIIIIILYGWLSCSSGTINVDNAISNCYTNNIELKTNNNSIYINILTNNGYINWYIYI